MKEDNDMKYDCSGEEETSGSWLRTRPEQPFLGPPPLAVQETYLWKTASSFLFCYVLFSAFLLKTPKHRAGSVWMLIYIQWESHHLVLLVQSLEQMLKSLLQKVTCASFFQLWDASFPAQVFRITVRVRTFSEGGRERGSDLFINLWHEARLAGSTCWLERKAHSPG